MVRKRRQGEWRRDVTRLSGQLGRAHSVVAALGSALDTEQHDTARRIEETARESVGFVAQSVETLGVTQRDGEHMDELDAAGSSLAASGGRAATVALDVMVDAMVALAATQDREETEFLVGTYVDAERTYEIGAAVVDAVPARDEPGLRDLERSFDTDGGKALREKVSRARSRVLEIRHRVCA
jgi:hypothetical protein